MVDILSEDFVIPNYAADLSELIEQQIDNKPDKTSPLYKEWKKMMNKIIDEHTKCVKFKAYKSIW